ncbi:metallophosphoesterase family protein [Microbacterium sp. BWT-B31]|uniref:fibronectin type III domain-containing protein n=1 Tax=Microbacterium sp. BWT-B31 TaxID=3232072 RepID=UPI0035299FBC
MSPTPHALARPATRGRRVAWISALAIGAAIAGCGLVAAPANAETTTSLTGIILGVGADETQRTVTWYTSTDSNESVVVAPSASVVNGVFPADSVTFAATGAANTSTTGFNRHATITGLKENTSYSYRVVVNDPAAAEPTVSPVYSFKTQSFEGDYDFLFFGDPQIGSSGNIAGDGAGWKSTLDIALAANPNAEILVSGGDQVETANTETQWDAFLAPDKLRQYPWAATIGNHDVGGKAYEQHLYTPNTDRTAPYYADASKQATTSGGDYWYIYKDVLFIDLNSNSYNSSGSKKGDDAHVAYVESVINEHGAEAKHTVLVYHHAIYSPASHAQDSDNKTRRLTFPQTFSRLGVDLVLQGHDHAYSRSYELKDGQRANQNETPGQADIYPGPGGVIYVTANSASGSKYYQITKPTGTDTGIQGQGADPANPSNYWYNSVQNQENKRTYVKVQVQGDQLVVENVRSEVSPQGEIGSTVDSVTIHKNHGAGEDIAVAVPDAAPGEFGWTIDGTNRLVDLGTAEQKSPDYFEAKGSLNPITVTDTRRARPSWSISASASDFADGDKSFSSKYLGWNPSLISWVNGATAGSGVWSGYDDDGAGLSQSRVLATATQGHDRGATQVGADLDLKVPTDTIEKGSYRATLTITALSE